MDIELKSKIIALVQQNRCIYNKNDQRYTNTAYKKIVWEHIGKELNIEGKSAQKLWRVLRGGYMRYKKAVKQHNNLQPYYWSEHLSFLDEDDVVATSSLPSGSRANSQWSSYCYLPQPSTLMETSDLPEIQVSESLVLYPQTSPRNTNSLRTSSIIDVEQHEELQMQRLPTQHFDSVDYLFMSYADTFKRMPLTQQAHLKVTMARLFAGAEINLINSGENL